MGPVSKQLLQGISARDRALTEQERRLLHALLSGIPPVELGRPEELSENLMTLSQVAFRFNVSEATVRRFEINRELVPVLVTPDLPRYLPEEVNAFLANRSAMRCIVRAPSQRRTKKDSLAVSLKHGT